MPLTLPNLDDRRWTDLVDEARALIPVYGPDWTDHNVHDPGIMLLELFAWIAETNVYRVNQVPERHRRKFLALLGVLPRGPQPSTTMVRAVLKSGTTPFALPAGIELDGTDGSGRSVRFRTLRQSSMVGGQLKAVQAGDGGRLQDLTGRWTRGEVIPVFGADAAPGASLYLGFSDPLPADAALTLGFTVADAVESAEERRRLIEEAAAAAAACCAPRSLVSCDEACSGASASGGTRMAHHSVTIVWEYFAGSAQWRAIPASQVVDDTRAFTLNGTVEIRSPAGLSTTRLGQVTDELYYLRCRLGSGSYEVAPQLLDVSMNGVVVEQAQSAGFRSWPIVPEAVVEGDAPSAGMASGFQLRLNARGEITHVSFRRDVAPSFYVLEYSSPSIGKPGALAIAADEIGSGSGEAGQECRLSTAPVLTAGVQLFTLEDGAWIAWSSRFDLDASAAGDPHFVLDPQSGVVTFGDGAHGRVPPAGAAIVAVYDATQGAAGNVDRDRITRLVDSPRNRALSASASLGTAQELAARFAAVGNPGSARTAFPLAAAGGADAETLEQAEERALELAGHGRQAVTAADYEALARNVPGTRVARAFARPNLHPSFPCITAPGIVTVLIVPELPAPASRSDRRAQRRRRRVPLATADHRHARRGGRSLVCRDLDSCAGAASSRRQPHGSPGTAGRRAERVPRSAARRSRRHRLAVRPRCLSLRDSPRARSHARCGLRH